MKKAFTLAEVLMPKRTSGIENKVLYSRESEGQAPSKTNKKLAAFTLAEVLITLAIIGVVAALTIPVVIHKYQQKAMYTQFMKSYNTVMNTVNMAVAENGNPETWTFNSQNKSAAMEQYLLQYLKVASKCAVGNSGCADYNIKALTGDDLNATFAQFTSNFGGDADSVTLADGSAIAIIIQNSNKNENEIIGLIFFIDVNGSKGPNTLGRDIFVVAYLGSWRTTSKGYKAVWEWDGAYIKAHQEEESDGSIIDVPSNCDPSGLSINDGMPNGLGCGGRLLLDGKMNY